MPQKTGLHRRLKKTLAQETAEGNFNDAAGAGSHGMGSHSLQSGMVQPCAKCADRKTGNKGRGTGVPQPFLFVGLVGQLRKRGFGKWFVKWQ
jgi:hypothetical protein